MQFANAERYINNVSESYLVNSDTGSVVTVIRPQDRVRVIRKESIENFQKLKDESVLINADRQFVKQFPDIAEKLCTELNPNEIWLLTFLIPYIGTNSGILKLPGGKLMGKADVVKLAASSMSKTVVYRTIAGLLDKGVLARCYVQNDMYYIVNPYVCHRGNKANATLLNLFKNTKWAKEANG